MLSQTEVVYLWGDDPSWSSYGPYEGAAPWKCWETNGYPSYFIRMESIAKDIKNIPLIMDNVDPSLLNQGLENHITISSYDVGGDRENGVRRWKHYYNQSLADQCYSFLKEGFELMPYEKDSWKS